MTFRRVEIQLLYFLSGPRGFSEEFQTGLDAGIGRKTSDLNYSPHFLPSQPFNQSAQYLFQRNAVERVVELFVDHLSALFNFSIKVKYRCLELLLRFI